MSEAGVAARRFLLREKAARGGGNNGAEDTLTRCAGCFTYDLCHAS